MLARGSKRKYRPKEKRWDDYKHFMVQAEHFHARLFISLLQWLNPFILNLDKSIHRSRQTCRSDTDANDCRDTRRPTRKGKGWADPMNNTVQEGNTESKSFKLFAVSSFFFAVFSSHPLINKQKTEVKRSHPSVLIPVLCLPVAEEEMNQWTEGGSAACARSLKPTVLLWSLLISFATLLPSPQIHSSHFQ